MLITKKSVFTGVETTLDLPITPEQWANYQNGMLIQRAMPNLTPDEREFIISGTLPDEWEKYMPKQDY